MSVRFEGPVSVAGVTVGVLSETRIEPHSRGGGVFVTALKRPLAILIVEGGVLRGVDMEGREMEPGRIDRLFPEARVRMGG